MLGFETAIVDGLNQIRGYPEKILDGMFNFFLKQVDFWYELRCKIERSASKGKTT